MSERGRGRARAQRRAGAGAGADAAISLPSGCVRRGQPRHLLPRRLRMDLGEHRALRALLGALMLLLLVPRHPQRCPTASLLLAARLRLQLRGLRHQLPLHELHGQAVFRRRWQPRRRRD